MPIPSPDGDIGADPPGFGRPAFLEQLSKEMSAYFEKIPDSAGKRHCRREISWDSRPRSV
jgi:hypothetical protein